MFCNHRDGVNLITPATDFVNLYGLASGSTFYSVLHYGRISIKFNTAVLTVLFNPGRMQLIHRYSLHPVCLIMLAAVAHKKIL